jgi:hypothetical protein
VIAVASTLHRFRPRYRGLAWSAVGVGGGLTGLAAVIGFVAVPLATGIAGVVLGATYLLSPTWKLAVTVDDDGLAVGSPARQRFRLPWSDVVKVVAAPSTSTCFVDGGAPERSLLVPGVGAPAPYDLEDRPGLLAAILAHVDPSRVERVESIEAARAALAAAAAAEKSAK